MIYIIPLEGAIRFQLRGALISTAAATCVYTLREVFGAIQYGNDFFVTSITFRMGIGFIIASVDAMASKLVAERREAERQTNMYQRLLRSPRSSQCDTMIANVDPAKVERIIENLVANAVKHTPPGTADSCRRRANGRRRLDSGRGRGARRAGGSAPEIFLPSGAAPPPPAAPESGWRSSLASQSCTEAVRGWTHGRAAECPSGSFFQTPTPTTQEKEQPVLRSPPESSARDWVSRRP